MANQNKQLEKLIPQTSAIQMLQLKTVQNDDAVKC